MFARNLLKDIVLFSYRRALRHNNNYTYSVKSILECCGCQRVFSSNLSRDIKDGESPTEELLERMITGLSTDIYNKSRIYKNDLLKILSKVKDGNFSSKRQGLLLLRCCSELLPDESPAARMALVEKVWDTIKAHTDFTVEHYNELLKCYVANNRSVNANAFLNQMGSLKPNEETFQLILEAVCEAGDVNQAVEIISNMKALGVNANENIFNSLIVGQGKVGRLENISEVITMMKSLKIEKSVDTHIAIAKAYAWNNKAELFFRELDVIRRKGFQLEEHHIMNVVKSLAKRGLYDPIPKVLRYLPEKTLSNPSISPYMQTVATQLVYQNHPMVALELYKCLPLPSFGPMDDKGLHGRTLVRECVKASVSSQIICDVAEHLMTSGRNPIALQSACEAALQMSKVNIAYDILTRMKEISLAIRTHYFWPILITSSKNFGEKGLMEAITKMVSMNVHPDFDTLYDYVLPYVSFSSPENLIRKISDCGMKVSDVLTPVLGILLNSGQLRSALQLCNKFKVNLDSEKLIKPLINGFISQRDTDLTVDMLCILKQRSEEKRKDWVGKFLCDVFTNRTLRNDIKTLACLTEAIKRRKLGMSSTAVEACSSSVLLESALTGNLRENLVQLTDESFIEESDNFQTTLPHPRHMNEKQLRAHLIELESKGMNTRGVLRKLIQMYCRTNNFDAAKELIDKCKQEDVFFSPGMLAAIFDLYVKAGQVELAEDTLRSLLNQSPKFTLDEHKVIDFATLLVKKGNLERAFDVVETHSQKQRIIGGRCVEKNCWRLLDAVASSKQPHRTRELFEVLTSQGFCSPTNVILGPLIRAHINSDNVNEAVEEFRKISEKYRQTPLKHELLCRVLQQLEDGQDYCSGDSLNSSAKVVLEADKDIHGTNSVQVTLLAALSEVGHRESLTKFLKESSVSSEAILKVTKWFAEKRKLEPLKVLSECLREVSFGEVGLIYEAILDIYKRNDDCGEALNLWESTRNEKVKISDEFVNNLISLLRANNIEITPELKSRKQTEQV